MNDTFFTMMMLMLELLSGLRVSYMTVGCKRVLRERVVAVRVCVCVGTICVCNARRDTLAGHVRWDVDDGELVRYRIGWFEGEFDGEFWPAERKILCVFAFVLLDI